MLVRIRVSFSHITPSGCPPTLPTVTLGPHALLFWRLGEVYASDARTPARPRNKADHPFPALAPGRGLPWLLGLDSHYSVVVTARSTHVVALLFREEWRTTQAILSMPVSAA